MSRILFLASHPFLGWTNGADLATLQLARQLVARGHTATIGVVVMDAPGYAAWRARFAPATGDRFTQGGIEVQVRRLTVEPPPHPDAVAAACARALDAEVAALIAGERPDRIVVGWGTVPLAQAARAHHRRVLLLVQNGLTAGDLGPDHVRGLAVATVSAPLARRLRARLGHEPLVVLNPIEPDAVVAAGGAHDRIGMVNFCAEKGAVVFLNVAANLPGARFVATGGWGGRAVDYTHMTTGLDRVELTPPYPRIGELYAALRLLLVPSLCEEAFGRVVIEAQLAGVPVVCTSRCPARAWASGIVVPVPPRPPGLSDERYYHDASLHRATIKAFLDAVVTLDDPDNHAVAVADARASAARYLIDQAASIDRFERWLAA